MNIKTVETSKAHIIDLYRLEMLGQVNVRGGYTEDEVERYTEYAKDDIGGWLALQIPRLAGLKDCRWLVDVRVEGDKLTLIYEVDEREKETFAVGTLDKGTTGMRFDTIEVARSEAKRYLNYSDGADVVIWTCLGDNIIDVIETLKDERSDEMLRKFNVTWMEHYEVTATIEAYTAEEAREMAEKNRGLLVAKRELTLDECYDVEEVLGTCPECQLIEGCHMSECSLDPDKA
jgi:hypothetical protein